MKILGRREIKGRTGKVKYIFNTTEGDMTLPELCKALGINRRTLWRRVKEYGLYSPEVVKAKEYHGGLEIYDKVLVPRPKYRPVVKWDTNRGLLTVEEVCTILGIRAKTFWKRLKKHGYHSRAITEKQGAHPKRNGYLDEPNEAFLELGDEDRSYLVPLVGSGLMQQWLNDKPTKADEWEIMEWLIEQKWQEMREEIRIEREPIWEVTLQELEICRN